jgi:hypothetical protein
MRVLLPSDLERLEVPPPGEGATAPAPRPTALRELGERLRATYDVGAEPLPARLNELVERLRRREQVER